MNKILCLLLSFLISFPVFSQDGEEIDFLDKVGEPKKATTSASKKAQAAKVPKKKKSKKSSKKRKSGEVRQDGVEQKEGETKKKVEATGVPDDAKNDSRPGDDGHSKNSENASSEKVLKKEEPRDLQKPYWVNEETALTPRHLPGYAETSAALPKEDISFKDKLGDILKMGQDKKKEEEKRKAAEQKDQSTIISFFSEYKKPIIILGLIVLFALYRLRAGGPRITRRSPVTINKVRRD
ncbi:Sec region non-globular protein [Leptospira inadai serovar Lyme str. 10]|uniref:Sec region non-globular protein n=2 Tax=Leptospira inadai serovar Lyme TaxID=293084 RepID=V6HAN5_9LEPT|nr:SRP-less Sec system protein [Leptospira inadai]EQA36292.1 Sec region non-globular protein [Leptospira inadai serovar Lyme str. 10]PNV76434.1 Sec region non-globular protein [Leptospira inadai serovar Lyme]